MPRVEKNDLIARISAKLGTGDDDLAIMNDLSDTLEPVDVSEYEKTIADLQTKNEELRAMYKARFTEPQAPIVPVEETAPVVVEAAAGTTEEPLSIEEIADKLNI